MTPKLPNTGIMIIVPQEFQLSNIPPHMTAAYLLTYMARTSRQLKSL